MIEAWFDGCCQPKNPGGHAAYGVIVKIDGMPLFRRGVYVGCGPTMSNNVAEYSGVCAVLREISKHHDFARIRGDSKLVINQLLGLWKARSGLYLPNFAEAKALYDPLRARVQLEWISREQNSECDELSKEVLRKHGVILRLQTDG